MVLTEAPPPQLDGPRSLEDLQQGIHIDGDSGISPMTMPPWLDMARCLRVQSFYREHKFNLALSWHCSLVIGFSLPSLLSALVFTHASDTPTASLKRYIRTAMHLALWHKGNIWDPASAAFKSIQQVRTMHAGVRMAMDSHFPGTKSISMYDLATVQTGFMGACTLFPSRLGIRASAWELDDYVYFWKCVGRQLGIDDKFNLCSLGKSVSDNIVQEIISTVLLPDIANPPAEYGPIAGAYINGLNSIFLGFRFFSIKSSLAVSYWGMGVPWGPLSFADTCRFYYLRFIIFLASVLSLYKRLLNWALDASLKSTHLDLSRQGEQLQCPLTGASMGGGGGCPFVSGGGQASPQIADDWSVAAFNPLGFALLMPLFTSFLLLIIIMLPNSVSMWMMFFSKVWPFMHDTVTHWHLSVQNLTVTNMLAV